jgi:ElaB/YqjD/DUF883 family membrane-anchored ribosome-binding protein
MNRHVAETNNDLGSLVEQSKELVGSVRNKAMAGAKATHKAVHEHPYKAIGIALGIGALMGFFLAHRGSSSQAE